MRSASRFPITAALSALLISACLSPVRAAIERPAAESSAEQAKAATPLSRARQLYNEQMFDGAIAAATEARGVSALEPAATVLFARAHLERFRQTSESADLAAAREALMPVDIAKLGARDRVEFFIALGESLYLDDQYDFDDRYSAAAEQFELALAQADELDATQRDLLFDWWAVSLDRQAQQGPENGRRLLYARIVTRAEAELARPDGAVAASYWLAAGTRGVDDLPRAAGAAAAGWVRAGSLGARGAALRVDLDRLMVQVILPERAKQLAPASDPRLMFAALEAQWIALKEKWEKPQP